ncbi:hypothetical protein Emed_006574 [Eimeria media]
MQPRTNQHAAQNKQSRACSSSSSNCSTSDKQQQQQQQPTDLPHNLRLEQLRQQEQQRQEGAAAAGAAKRKAEARATATATTRAAAAGAAATTAAGAGGASDLLQFVFNPSEAQEEQVLFEPLDLPSSSALSLMHLPPRRFVLRHEGLQLRRSQLFISEHQSAQTCSQNTYKKPSCCLVGAAAAALGAAAAALGAAAAARLNSRSPSSFACRLLRASQALPSLPRVQP